MIEPKPVMKLGVPIPPKLRGRPRSKRWEFLYEMEVEQSAHFDFEDKRSASAKKFKTQLFSIVARYQKESDKKFVVRSTEEGVGVWRIE